MKYFVRIFLLLTLLVGGVALQPQPAHAEVENQTFAAPILVVNTSFLNVRTGPSARFGVLTTVVGGTELPVLGTAGDEVWYQVSTAVGVGWVNLEFTIPRGDFVNVPLVSVTTPPTNPTIIELPATVPVGTGVQVSPVTGGTTTTTTEVVTVTRAFANQNVNAYELPNFDSNPLIVLFGGNEDVDYPVVGSTVTEGIVFFAIDIPNVGVAWVEGTKLGTREGTVTIITNNVQPAAAGDGVIVDNTLGQGGGGSTGIIVPPTLNANVAVVNTSFLNIRSGPGAQYTQVFTARGGAQYNVVGIASDGVWLLVEGPFGQGWLNNAFVLFRGNIESVPIIRNAAGTVSTPIVVIGNSVQLYAAPGTNFGLLGSVAGPVEAAAVARTQDFEWVQINTSAGFGWVLASQVTLRGDTSLIPIVAG